MDNSILQTRPWPPPPRRRLPHENHSRWPWPRACWPAAARRAARAALPATAPRRGGGGAGAQHQRCSRCRAAKRRAACPSCCRPTAIRSQPDLETVAEGHVEFRRGGTVISADRLSYDTRAGPGQRARPRARGASTAPCTAGPSSSCACSASRATSWSPSSSSPGSAPAAAPTASTSWASRARAPPTRPTPAARATAPRSRPGCCARAASALDFDANEGVAEGAVLRFLGAPILALPTLSFPLTDARKSGWLPPSVNIDNRSGVELAVPYYWNIAPNRDATIAPRVMHAPRPRAGHRVPLPRAGLRGRRAAAVAAARPRRPAARARRWSGRTRASSAAGCATAPNWRASPTTTGGRTFPNAEPQLHRRGCCRCGWRWSGRSRWPAATARSMRATLRWQVLQASDSFIVSPYERSPQLGVRLGGQARRLALRAGDRIQPLHAAARPGHRAAGAPPATACTCWATLQPAVARAGLVGGAAAVGQRRALLQQRRQLARGRRRPRRLAA